MVTANGKPYDRRLHLAANSLNTGGCSQSDLKLSRYTRHYCGLIRQGGILLKLMVSRRQKYAPDMSLRLTYFLIWPIAESLWDSVKGENRTRALTILQS